MVDIERILPVGAVCACVTARERKRDRERGCSMWHRTPLSLNEGHSAHASKGPGE